MANEYLKRTPSSTGNRLKGTWSFWIKRSTLNGTSTVTFLFNGTSTGTDGLRFNDDDGGDSLRILFRNPSSNNSCFINFDKLRDPSSWQHYLITYDSTLNTIDGMSTNSQELQRIKLFVNGRRMIETGGNSAQNPGLTANQLMQNWGVAGVPNVLFGADGGSNTADVTAMDAFFVDGQALTPDVFGFNKEGKGYISVGSTQATDFRPGQWLPKSPRVIKTEINRRGGFGVNGFYLPLNDHKNFGADHHMIPDTIIKLNTDLPQPKVSIASTSQAGVAYTDVLRSDPYYDSLVLALPFVRGGLGTDGTSSGSNTGFGDYSHVIRGTGSAKVPKLYGSVAIGNTGAYYGSSANFGDAGGDDYILVDASSDFVYGTNDWTIETWWYPTAVSRQAIYHGSYGTDWSLGIDFNSTSSNPHKLGFWASSTGSSWNIANADGGGNGICGVGVTSGQWYHIAYEKHDETLSLYLNGVAVGIVTGVTASIDVTSSDKQAIGVWYNTTAMNEISGYLQDFRIYNGVAKYKGGFDVPKHFSPVGIETFREVPDTCTNNFATFNAIGSGLLDDDGDGNTSATYTNGNLTAVLADNAASARSTIGIHTGKWYWETRIDVNSSAPGVGIVGLTTNSSSYSDAEGASYEPRNDRFRKARVNFYDGSNNKTDNGLIVGVALDKNVGIISFFADGTLQSSGTMTGINTLSTYHLPECFTHNDGASNTFTVNYGQNPTFSGQVTAGTNTDANGRGLFKYAVPTGFLSLCEDNLPTPAIADPSDHFKCVLYEGDGEEGHSITGVGFKPDLVWIKSRSFSNNHHLFDVVRGPNKILRSSSTDAETTPGNIMPSFNTDGFTVGEDGGNNATNDDGNTFVAWCWKAGGAAVANTDGSINSSVSANQTAGFSIVSYTGNGTSGTVGHGLGKTPNIVLVKNRIDSSNWSFNGNIGGLVYGTNKLILQTSDAIVSDTNEVTSANATTFTLGNSGATNGSSDALIAYCWTEIEGYSKFGSYIGNGNADGPFVYCGFKPAWVMVKCSSNGSTNWRIWDSSRGSTNPTNLDLLANTSDSENSYTSDEIDLLSNGFKIRSTGSWHNLSGGSLIFMAFAESPFQTANAK